MSIATRQAIATWKTNVAVVAALSSLSVCTLKTEGTILSLFALKTLFSTSSAVANISFLCLGATADFYCLSIGSRCSSLSRITGNTR